MCFLIKACSSKSEVLLNNYRLISCAESKPTLSSVIDEKASSYGQGIGLSFDRFKNVGTIQNHAKEILKKYSD